MNRTIPWVLLLLLAALGAGCGQKGETQQSAAETEDGRKVLYWRSAMDPSFISDAPGKDRMGMELVPVYEGEESQDARIVSLDEGTVQKIGIRIGRVERRPIAREIRAVGIVTYDETRVAHIHTKVNGWIQKLYVDYTGQFVNKDDPLFSIYSPELVTTQQEYLLALKARKYLGSSPIADISRGADDLLKSTRERLRLFDVDDSHVQKLIETGTPEISIELHSPISGYVIEKNALEGMYTTPAMKLYTIADLSTVWVDADIYEYEVPFVEVGQQVMVRLAYDPGNERLGRVSYIYPYLDPKTRTVKVRMEFRNPDYALKPEMYVDAYIRGRTVDAIVVPKEAVLRTGKRDVVFVSLGDGKFEARELQLGVETDRDFQVLSGVEPGEDVILSAQFLLDSESNLQEAIVRMRSGADTSGSPESGDASQGPSEEGDSGDASVDH